MCLLEKLFIILARCSITSFSDCAAILAIIFVVLSEFGINGTCEARRGVHSIVRTVKGIVNDGRKSDGIE